MKLLSYWHDTAAPFSGAATGALPGKADVVVVGGGFTGLSAALRLAKDGANVVLLEAGKVIGLQSGRNGGHVNNGTAHDVGGLAARFGLDHARRLYQAYDAAVDTVERIVKDEGIDCDFRRSGKIKLAAKPTHYESLARSFDLLNREIDPETELVPAARIRSEIGSDAFFGGLLYKKSGQMHMGRFGKGLADAALRAGATIFEDAPVTEFRRLSCSRYRLSTPRGAIEAGRVLLATGATKRGPGFFRRRIIPIGSFIIATEPLSAEQQRAIMPTSRTATTTKYIGNYFRLTADGRLIFGGRARFALSNPSSDVKSGRILEDTLYGVYPQLRGVRIDYCWGGEVDITADRLPRAGEHEGMLYAMGYSGHGAQMSVHMGQQMARYIGGDMGANPLAGLDWPAVPGHFGPTWFLPFVGAYYKIKDIIE